jgi:acyl-CoA dehydrogenase
VNIALIVKFMPNFFFNPAEFPEIATQSQPANDDFLFHQGGAKGLGQIQFNDYHRAFADCDLANVKLFLEQVEVFRALLTSDAPGPDQMKDIDVLLAAGDIFALVVYAQLLLENAKIYGVEDALLDQIFDFMVRDMSKCALALHNKPTSTERQMAHCRDMIRRPVHDAARYDRVWAENVKPLSGAYEMHP